MILHWIKTLTKHGNLIAGSDFRKTWAAGTLERKLSCPPLVVFAVQSDVECAGLADQCGTDAFNLVTSGATMSCDLRNCSGGVTIQAADELNAQGIDMDFAVGRGNFDHILKLFRSNPNILKLPLKFMLNHKL